MSADPPRVKIVPAGIEEAATILRIMRLSFEEYRGKLYPESGALRETLDDVRSGILDGGAFLAFVGEGVAGSARFRFQPGHVYGERIGVLPAYRGQGIAAALTKAIETTAVARNIRHVRVQVRASIPSNLRLYEKLGYRFLESIPYPVGTDVSIALGKDLGVDNR
jgi:ribosomal protein S18 acetylase RimI-like enzyme